MGKNLLCFLQAWSQEPQHHRASEAPHFLCRTEHQSQGQARLRLSTEKVTNLTNFISTTCLFVKSVPVPSVWTQLNFTPASSEKNSTDLRRSPWVNNLLKLLYLYLKNLYLSFQIWHIWYRVFVFTGSALKFLSLELVQPNKEKSLVHLMAFALYFL